MKKKLTRLFSVLLAAVLVLGTLPVSAMGTDVADPPASAVDDTPVEVSTAEPEEASAVDETPNGEEAQSGEVEAAATYASTNVQYKIVHLDCGRKYFSKEWIIALLYEMQNDGYNQLQLAFGNDGLRFLLNDMAFTANGTTYDNDTVVAKVKAGNKTQNNSGDERYLTETEMDEIIDKANELDIEIVPLLNLPGHANAILDIADDAYNASGSNNTLDVANSDVAREFGKAIFVKYVDYFAGKGCKFFNFGADEYANDATGAFSFSRLNSTQYQAFVSFINDLAGYVINKNMTPRAFNDGFYYNRQNMDANTSLTSTQICYWSPGWSSYNLAAASTIKSNQHSLINTNGDYYYVLGKHDKFTPGTTKSDNYKDGIKEEYNTHASNAYSNASTFDNSVYPTYTWSGWGTESVQGTAGSMFCIWCDYPNFETEQEVAANTRLVLRAMAQRMNNQTVSVSDNVVANGFNADGTINNTVDDSLIKISVGDSTEAATSGKLAVDGSMVLTASKAVIWESSDYDVASLTPIVEDGANAIVAKKVEVTALKAGNAIITATDPADESNTASVELNVVTEDYGAEINLTVGETKTLTNVDGAHDGDLLPGDTVATVTGAANTLTSKYKSVTTFASGANEYYVSTYSNANSIDNSKAKIIVEYTDGSYYLKNENGNYIYPRYSKVVESTDPVAVTFTPYSGGFTVYCRTSGYYLSVSNNALTGGWGGNTLYFYKDAVQTSTITFTGNSVGTTYVTIGNTKYKITVSPTPLTIEYWITNAKVYESDKNSASSAKISAADAYSEEGVAVENSVPAIANTYFNGDTAVSVYYWQTMRLADRDRQTAKDGNDGTSKGETLTHIRYLNSKWQYKTLVGDWKDFQSDDQVVAYYLQKTDVTKEITTYVKDWGFDTSKTTEDWSDGKGQVALTVAVVYPDGTVSPAEGKLYANSTTIFNYWAGRDIGIISPTNNSDYTISKITVTDGKRDKNTSANVWYSTDTITWDKKANENGEEWYDETTVWDETQNAGTTPMVNGKNSNITWSAKNTAKLVLIYLKPIEKASNLIVRYWNSSSNEEITHSQVVMTYHQGDQEPTFTSALKNVDGNVIGGTTKWPGKTSGESGYLPDGAYVTNSSNVNQKFNKTLSAVPGVSEKYKSGVYSYNGADISEDGKTLTLYYVVDQNKTKADYVLDFGTPVQIPMSDFVENSAKLTSVTWNDNELRAGTLSYDQESKVITYTPKKVLEGNYALNFKLQFSDGASGSVTIGVAPASNVLYEEGFLTTTDTLWSNADAKSHTDAQETQKAKESKSVFGYDGTYNASVGANGVWKAEGLTRENYTKEALTTTFYGNTFDLIGNCAPDTGRVLMVIKDANDKYAAIVNVDTRYTGTISQVPLAHVKLKDGSDAQYTVYIYASGLEADAVENKAVGTIAMGTVNAAAYEDEFLNYVLSENDLTLEDVDYISTSVAEELAESDASGEAANNVKLASEDGDSTKVHHVAGTHVEIDGFRVYRSTADDVAKNYPESEQNVEYKNILDVVGDVVTAYTEGGTVTNCAVTAYEAKGGPQNEIYLEQNQSVVIQVSNATPIQVSLRAVSGETSWSTSSNPEDERITSNTEMYYTITPDEKNNVTITNKGKNLLALGNVKAKGTDKFVSAENMDPDDVLESIRAAYGSSSEEPEVFAPETFTAKTTVTPVVRNKMVTLKVNVSSDVAYITVNGVKYTRTGLQGLFQKTRTIRVVNTVKKGQTKTYEVVAYNADGVASETITVTG